MRGTRSLLSPRIAEHSARSTKPAPFSPRAGADRVNARSHEFQRNRCRRTIVVGRSRLGRHALELRWPQMARQGREPLSAVDVTRQPVHGAAVASSVSVGTTGPGRNAHGADHPRRRHTARPRAVFSSPRSAALLLLDRISAPKAVLHRPAGATAPAPSSGRSAARKCAQHTQPSPSDVDHRSDARIREEVRAPLGLEDEEGH